MTDNSDNNAKRIATVVASRFREAALTLVRAASEADMAEVANELWNLIGEDDRVGFERENFKRMLDIIVPGIVAGFGAVPDGMTRFEFFRATVMDVWLGLMANAGTTPTVRARIDRELIEAAKTTRAGDSPAVQSAVVLVGGVSIQGSLSRADDGLLRLLTPTGTPPAPMVEQFFSDDDVVAFAVVREVTVETPRIIRS